jgi:hypothetical protein
MPKYDPLKNHDPIWVFMDFFRFVGLALVMPPQNHYYHVCVCNKRTKLLEYTPRPLRQPETLTL